jgi:hypothetical protein
MNSASNHLHISIGFSTTRQFSSRFIRWITASSCSHAFIAFDDSALGLRMVMQAQPWGFELRPWNRWLRENILVAEFRPVGPSLDRALTAIAERLGTKFNYRSAIIIGVKSLLSSWHRNRFTLNINRSPWKLTCSESVVRFLVAADYRAASGLDPETTSPGQLLRIILRSAGEFRPLTINAQYVLFDRSIRRSPGSYEHADFPLRTAGRRHR